MTNRRDLLKIAAGLGLTGTIPTIADRVAAMKLLDQPVSPHPVLDPATFAWETDGAGSEHLGNDWGCAINAEIYAEWIQNRAAFIAAVPALASRPFNHPFTKYEETTFDLSVRAYTVGIRHGAAYENLRRTVIGDLSQCRTCWGVGITEISQPCRSCGGTGVVATGMQSGATGGG